MKRAPLSNTDLENVARCVRSTTKVTSCSLLLRDLSGSW